MPQLNYRETLDYLYSKLPMFTCIGEAAYKKDLTNTLALCEALGNPHNKFKSIHIAGTNGKGSVSHYLAAILQKAGYKTGLYSSPHLLDFRERIKINGKEIPEKDVIEFTGKHQDLIEKIQPSFFEVTVAMAFDHFAKEKVDIAVIETGLGGRLDSTNIIEPVLSVITNISFDHQNLLGESLAEIAGEKAGIIKTKTPVVIGKTQEETKMVFEQKVKETGSEIVFADENTKVSNPQYEHGFLRAAFEILKQNKTYHILSPLAGNYQLENISTVLHAIQMLNKNGFNISDANITEGIKSVKLETGLLGRWEIIKLDPLTICDVAHNEAGLKAVFEQINSIPHKNLRIIYGMVKDKDINKALGLLPPSANYYFSQPDLPRALDVNSLFVAAEEKGLKGRKFESIKIAYEQAQKDAHADDIVLVAGSIFVVAEVLAFALQSSKPAE